MKKRLLLCLAALVLIAALLTVGMPLVNRLVYGRSAAATLMAWQLHRESYTTDEAFAGYLSQKQEENAAGYELPSGVWSAGAPELREYGGLSCYVLNASSRRLVLFFAGGSYIDPPRTVHWQFLDALARDGDAAVVVPLYPLLPDGDALTACGALTSFYREITEAFSPDALVFMGDSAGGGLALSFAMQLRDGGLPGPERLILLSPWLDVTLSNPEIPAFEKKDPALDAEQLRHLGSLWAGDLSADDPVASPLYGSFEGLGRITIYGGTAELLYPDIMALDGLLTEAGIEHDTVVGSGMFHVWPLYMAYSIPEAEEAYADIVRIVSS